MDNQSLGLAEALGLDVQIRRIEPTAFWKNLPPAFWLAPLHYLTPESDRLVPPWPDVVIGTGRLNVAASVAIREQSRGKTLNIRVQHPRVPLGRFDFIVAPQHDHCRGGNVIETIGAVNRVTHVRLAEGAARFAAMLADLPRPFVTLLLGGSNSRFTLDEAFARRLAGELSESVRSQGGSLLVTPSRRTAAEVIAPFRDLLREVPGQLWDGQSENPYFGWLALADYIVVTADSVNMASEAAFTGKPVLVSGLTGRNNKFEQFHRSLQERGCARPFTGELVNWQYEPLDETRRAASLIRQQTGW